MAAGIENILSIEKSLLRGVWSDQIPRSSNLAVELAKLEVECRFRDVLTSKPAISLFQPTSGDTKRPFQDIFTELSRDTRTGSVEDELTCLVVAIACLHAFIQANWTGPDLDIHPLELLSQDSDIPSPWTEGVLHSKAVQELAYGGEPAYHLSKVPAFLRFAQLLVSFPYEHIQSITWWRLRVTSVHQRVLDEPVILHEDFRASMLPLLTVFATESDLVGRIYLELGLLDVLSQGKLAAEYFIKAARATGLEYELSGVLGKRTRFQASEIPQLVLLAESRLDDNAVALEQDGRSTSNEQGSYNNAISRDVPEALPLNDDTLLENTEFTSSQPMGSTSRLSHIDPSSQPPLHPLDQCIVLSLCLSVRNTSPAHGLTTEQMTPYVSRVILHPRNWSIHSMALLLRSRLESSRTRTIERSTLQLQALIDQMPTSDSKTSERLLYFHDILLPSQWEMERELAQRYLSLGIIKSALEILERLERWEDVVKCYGSLEKQEKGITIVRDLLEGRKEEADVVLSQSKLGSAAGMLAADAAHQAKLWCLLGDLEPANAIDHYQKAWTISNQTSGRAMRSLGGTYFAQGNYSDTIDCLKEAVKINPLLLKTWFILGCAYMRKENWEEAKNAFGRCVMIDEEDGESWNNLASMHLRMVEKSSGNEQPLSFLEGDKEVDEKKPFRTDKPSKSVSENKVLALRALKQGLRYSYENWRMWYNYMILSMDVGELQESCRALGRVIELTSIKAGMLTMDEDVLDRLVNAVTRALPIGEADIHQQIYEVHNPNEGHGLYRNVLLLLEQTILPRLSSPRIFRAYGRLLSWKSQWEQAVKAYLDAYRCSQAASLQSGEVDTETWQSSVGEVEEIVSLLQNFGPRVAGYNWKLQCRSILRTFMSRSKDFEKEPEWARLQAIQEELQTQ